ncbi:MAG TPA: leucyl aminopeptidase [Thermoanaerobaculia bacterium]|jgi:leucyl aminopeptidase|nr:leucyl aminopeptidase [Thermoanaerobaculia bacterium]
MMEIPSLLLADGGGAEAELLAVGCFQGAAPELEALPEQVRRAALGIAARPGWKGREEQVGQADAGAPGQVVALYGLGAAAELSFAKLARWLGRVAEDARTGGVRRLGVVLPRHAETTGAAAGRICRALALCGYRFERYRSEPDNGRLEAVVLVPPAGAEADYRAALDTAAKVASAVAYARDLANTPGNEATPAWIEERARELAASHGLSLTVLDAAELARRGMGGLLAVGGGSEHPPRMLRLALGDTPGPLGPHGTLGEHRGGSDRSPRPVVALVGKGVTFDSGGISIKPAADMEQMKFDKSGACAVLGAMRAAAELELDLGLRAYLPLAENMLSGGAYRPGDIVRCYNGKTVEITNTDAEGRMILADALAWAVEEGSDALVELSTLTGACVVALGHQAAGLFTPDDGLAAELDAAAADSGERLWRLPLLPEFLDDMKSLHADLRNSAGRWGAASTAAAFLSQFVGGLRRWAHLDIAGMAYARSEDGRGTAATGFGVALLADWLRRQAG